MDRRKTQEMAMEIKEWAGMNSVLDAIDFAVRVTWMEIKAVKEREEQMDKDLKMARKMMKEE